jgi:hypothetical protein
MEGWRKLWTKFEQTFCENYTRNGWKRCKLTLKTSVSTLKTTLFFRDDLSSLVSDFNRSLNLKLSDMLNVQSEFSKNFQTKIDDKFSEIDLKAKDFQRKCRKIIYSHGVWFSHVLHSFRV